MGLPERSKGALGLLSATYIPAQIASNAWISGSAHIGLMLMCMSNPGVWNFVTWLKVTAVWMVVIIAGSWIYSAIVCKPAENVEFPADYFKNKYRDLGKISPKEVKAAILLVLCIAVWSTSSIHGMDTTLFGLIVVCLMFYLDLFTTVDLITRVPWSMMVQIGGLLALSAVSRPSIGAPTLPACWPRYFPRSCRIPLCLSSSSSCPPTSFASS